MEWSRYFQNPLYMEMSRRFLLNPDMKLLVARYLGIRPGWRILDVGCGTGAFTRYLAETLTEARTETSEPAEAAAAAKDRGSALQGCTLIGIDNDRRFVETARRIASGQGLERLEFRVGDAYDLPFPRDRFDLVVSHTLLGSVSDPGRAMAEMKRVAAAGGTIASVTSMSLGHQVMHPGRYPAECLWAPRLASLEAKVWGMYEALAPLSLYTEGAPTAEIPHLFSEHGLESICIYPIGRAFSLSNAAMPAEEKRDYITGMYEADVEKIGAFRQLEGFRKHLSGEECEEYIELIGRRRDFLLGCVGENAIWDWHGGANLLVVGRVGTSASARPST